MEKIYKWIYKGGLFSPFLFNLLKTWSKSCQDVWVNGINIFNVSDIISCQSNMVFEESKSNK